eukprot:760492-Hanusia_phi.AAC.2
MQNLASSSSMSDHGKGLSQLKGGEILPASSESEARFPQTSTPDLQCVPQVDDLTSFSEREDIADADQNSSSILCTSITTRAVSSLFRHEASEMAECTNEDDDEAERFIKQRMDELALKLADNGRNVSVMMLHQLIQADEEQRLFANSDILRECFVLILIVDHGLMASPFLSHTFDLLSVNRLVYIMSSSKGLTGENKELRNKTLNEQMYNSIYQNVDELAHVIKAKPSTCCDEQNSEVITFVYR